MNRPITAPLTLPKVASSKPYSQPFRDQLRDNFHRHDHTNVASSTRGDRVHPLPVHVDRHPALPARPDYYHLLSEDKIFDAPQESETVSFSKSHSLGSKWIAVNRTRNTASGTHRIESHGYVSLERRRDPKARPQKLRPRTSQDGRKVRYKELVADHHLGDAEKLVARRTVLHRVERATAWKEASENKWEYVRQLHTMIHAWDLILAEKRTAEAEKRTTEAEKRTTEAEPCTTQTEPSTTDAVAAKLAEGQPTKHESLQEVLIGAAPYFWIRKSELIRVLQDHFAHSQQQRIKCEKAVSVVFVALDDQLRGEIDWRDLVAHMRVIEMPKQHISRKLLWMFDLYSRPFSYYRAQHKLKAIGKSLTHHHDEDDRNPDEQVVDLYNFWKIVQTGCTEEEKDTLFETLVRSLKAEFGRPSMPHHKASSGSGNQEEQKSSVEDVQTVQMQFIKLHQMYKHVYVNRTQFTHMTLGKNFVDEEERIKQLQAKKDKLVFEDDTGGGESALYELFCVQYWNRLPSRVRLELTRNEQEKAAARYQKVHLQMKNREAVQFFASVMAPNLLRNRFTHWHKHVLYRRKVRRGKRHWAKRCKQKAIEQLEMWTEGRVIRREQNKLAFDIDVMRKQVEAFECWRAYTDAELQHDRVKIEQVAKLVACIKMEHTLRDLRMVTRMEKAMRKAANHYDRVIAERVMGRWKDWCFKEKEEREEQERLAEMRQNILIADMEDAKRKEQERVKQEEEDQKLELFEQKRIAEARERRAEREEEQRLLGLKRLAAQKKYEKQVQERRDYKVAKRKQELEMFEKVWEGLMNKAVEEAQKESESYLKTPEGRHHLERETKLLAQDVELMAQNPQEKGVDLCGNDDEWVKIFDETFKEYFFYNTKTGEKREPTLLTENEVRDIARSRYVASQVELARKDALLLKQQEFDRENEERAARIVQGIWKTRKSRQTIRALIATIYVKRTDPFSGKPYYYNLVTKESDWIKPRNLGHTDLYYPQWVFRYKEPENGEGEPFPFYENTISPWLSTATKPPGLIPCTNCNLQLATDKCKECSAAYCLDCFEAAHQQLRRLGGKNAVHDSRERFHPDVQYCGVCSVNGSVEEKRVAEVACKGCNFDCFCNDCFSMIHSNHPERMYHEWIPI